LRIKRLVSKGLRDPALITKIVSIDYVLTVETGESDQRLELLHKNVRKYGTISNTVAAATELNGVIRRQA
jgi:hypothetical protein